MTILPLVISPDPLLKEISQPVAKIDDALRQFMKDMVQTMYYQHELVWQQCKLVGCNEFW